MYRYYVIFSYHVPLNRAGGWYLDDEGEGEADGAAEAAPHAHQGVRLGQRVGAARQRREQRGDHSRPDDSGGRTASGFITRQ